MSMKHRALELEVRSIDEEKRQATFVASTERAVSMGFGDPEVLRAKGVRLERYKKNPVLLDAHDRSETGCVIGRCDVSVEGRRVIAVATYAKTKRAQDVWDLVKDGFVRAVSIGYQTNPKKTRRLRAGEIDGDGDGRVEGPASVVDEWELLEVSNVPVPADEDAVRRSVTAPSDKKGPKRTSKETLMKKGINYGKVVARESADTAGDDEGREETDAEGARDDGMVECPGCGEKFQLARAEDGEDEKPEPKPEPKTEEKGKKSLQLLPEERSARVLEANRRAVLAITPRGLEHVAESALAEGLGLEAARKKILEAQAARFKPVGTLEPAPIDGGKKDENERSASLPKEVTDEVLIRSLESLTD